MCWSADADLAAGTAIAALGIGCVVGAARRRRPRDVPLAALPVLLGVHQIIESVVWRGTMDEVSASTASAARAVWAVIAVAALPLVIPWAVYLASSPVVPDARRRLLLALCAIGTATAVAMSFVLDRTPVTADVRGHTMNYGIDIPWPWLLVGGYLLATLGSLLAAPDPTIRVLGAACLLGASVCILIWEYEFASTWCALAAVASLILLRWAWTGPARGSSAPRVGGPEVLSHF